MTSLEDLGFDLHAASEAVRVEELEQRREAVGVAVVRRGGEEEAVREAPAISRTARVNLVSMP
jgi:hypothetical protein